MLRNYFFVILSLSLSSCSGPNLSGVGDGIACAMSSIFGPDHGAKVNTDASEVQITLAKVTTYAQLAQNPAADAYVTAMSDRIFAQVSNDASVEANENFDESFYKRYFLEALLHSKRDQFKSNCYLFSYSKIVKSDDKTEDGKPVNLALNSSLMLRFNDDTSCDFSEKSTHRPQQKVSYCNTNGRDF
jgi:hypothetical protein